MKPDTQFVRLKNEERRTAAYAREFGAHGELVEITDQFARAPAIRDEALPCVSIGAVI
jgi:hypothetical protein